MLRVGLLVLLITVVLEDAGDVVTVVVGRFLFVLLSLWACRPIVVEDEVPRCWLLTLDLR